MYNSNPAVFARANNRRKVLTLTNRHEQREGKQRALIAAAETQCSSFVAIIESGALPAPSPGKETVASSPVSALIAPAFSPSSIVVNYALFVKERKGTVPPGWSLFLSPF